MPVEYHDIFEDAQSFYVAMIRDLVTDIPMANGQFRPQLKFSELVKRVAEEPKPAQVLVQILYQKQGGTDSQMKLAAQHGTWVMAALISAFGIENSSVQMVRRFAPEYYEEAAKILQNSP